MSVLSSPVTVSVLLDPDLIDKSSVIISLPKLYRNRKDITLATRYLRTHRENNFRSQRTNCSAAMAAKFGQIKEFEPTSDLI